MDTVKLEQLDFVLSDALNGAEWFYGTVNGVSKRIRIPHTPTAMAIAVQQANAYTDTAVADILSQATTYSDDVLAQANTYTDQKADWTQYGTFRPVLPAVGEDAAYAIVAAIEQAGAAGGGTVVVRAANGTDPIYINSPIQIEYSNIRLVYESAPLLYGPNAFQRINGGLAEVIRTELGQTNILKLRANSYTNGNGQMVLPLQTGGGAYLVVGDLITVRGQNDANGVALTKQVTKVVSISVDDVTCSDEPDETFQATYPESEWPSDWTTGTTVAISAYTPLTVDGVRGSDTLTVASTSFFNIGDLCYINDARTEADLMAPVVTNLRSAANMEIARVVDKTETTLTFDRKLIREFPVAWQAGVTKMAPVVNSHIIIAEAAWSAPQPNRKNSATAINYSERCTIEIGKMDGKAGRLGAAARIGYSYDCHILRSGAYDAYGFNSAEGYGLTIYYSTLCTIRDSVAVGGRHNFLLQTATLCTVRHNFSGDDFISGIDLHGANCEACIIQHNVVSRSNRHAPGVTNGGGIRNGNTSHTIGDHNTLIDGNVIINYLGALHSAIDVSPSSRNCMVRNNFIIDCEIGVRHYKVGSSITPAQHADRVTICFNSFVRVNKIFDIKNHVDYSYWDKVIVHDNKAYSCPGAFVIEDVPHVIAMRNDHFHPTVPANGYAFEFRNIAKLRVYANYADETPRGAYVSGCADARVCRNYFGTTVDNMPVVDGGGNTSLVSLGNTDSEGGGGGPITTADITDFTEAVQDAIAACIAQNGGLSLVYDDTAGTLTIAATMTDAAVKALIGSSVEAGAGIGVSYNATTGKTTVSALSAEPALTGLIIPLGDSRSYQNWSYTNTVPALLARSPLFVAEQLSQRCRVDHRYGMGVSGDEVEQIWTRIQSNTLNAYGFGPQDVPAGTIWFFLAGTNNATGATDKAYMDSVLAVHQQIVDWIVARGDRVIVATEWPRDGAGLTANEQKLFMYYVQKLKRQYVGRRNVWTTDVWAEGADPASTTASPIANLLNPDGLHNSPGIAYLQGKKIAELLKEWGLPVIYRPTATNADVYDATLNPSGNLMSNPMMMGTAGTVSTNATGVAPDGWTLDASSGLSVVGSRESIEVNGVMHDVFKMVISGTTSATGAYARLRKSGLISAAIIGDVMEAGCEFVIEDGHVNYCAVGIVIDPAVSADQVHGGVNLGGANADNQFPNALVEKFYACPRSPRYTVPDPLPASLAVDFRVRFAQSGVASSATVWFLSSSFRKV